MRNGSVGRSDRRRRVLFDDVNHIEPAPVDKTEAAGVKTDSVQETTARQYSRATLTEAQPRIVDLIPRHIAAILGAVVLASAAISGLHLLSQSAELATHWTSISLTSDRNIVSWVNSFLLLLAAGGAWMVYALQQHRTDDYRGKYRWWLWALMLFLFASLETGSGLHMGWATELTRISWLSNLSATACAYMFHALPVATLLWFVRNDIRRSINATMHTTIAVGCFLTAAGLGMSQSTLPWVESLLLSHGYLFCVAACWSLARFIFLEAQMELAGGAAATSARVKVASKPRGSTSTASKKTNPQEETREPEETNQPASANESRAATKHESKSSPKRAPKSKVAETEDSDPEPQDDRRTEKNKPGPLARQVRIDSAHHDTFDDEEDDSHLSRKARKKRRRKQQRR